MATIVWFDKSSADPTRPWCVQVDGLVRRAKAVTMGPGARTSFEPAGHLHCQPGGPRGVILCDWALSEDSVPVEKSP